MFQLRRPLVASVLCFLFLAPHRGAHALDAGTPVRDAGVPLPAIAPPSLEARVQAISEAFEERRRKHGVPGAALVIVAQGRVVLMRGFGARDVERELPVTADTRFLIGSVTKSFTSALAGLSVEEQRLDLDEPLRRYLPDFQWKDAELRRALTLRDLLCHRSGLDRAGDKAMGFGVLTRAELLQLLARAEPGAPLRASFGYSNLGYVVVGEALAAAYGAPYEQLVEQKLLQPLGMSASGFGRPAQESSAEPSRGYERRGGDPTRVAPYVAGRHDTLLEDSAAGALFSTARDMARWLRMLTERGTLDGQRLLQASTVEELWREHLKTGWGNGNPGYALGWFTRQWRGQPLVEHGGNVGGFETSVELIPSQGVGFVMLTNVTASPLRREARELVFSRLLDLPEPPPAPAASPSPEPVPASSPVPLTVDALMNRMIRAQGGRGRLSSLGGYEVRSRVRYPQQALESELVLTSGNGHGYHQVETYSALGKPLGREEFWLSGDEAWFGKAAVGEPVVARALSKELALENRRALALDGDLRWKTEWARVELTGMSEVDGEPCYVLRRSAPDSDPVEDLVSTRRFVVLLRRQGEASEKYSDFRKVGGLLLPFRTEVHQPGGMSSVREVTSWKLGVRTRDLDFRPPQN
ncbi:beta-lactamase family protein [Pyxidicoccus parkwayensis]|uniref:Beta-lactamase family protein n=1 Tax=Pyxidicoccus parkwayensis TaxID=2813578 RepID=A0ABX7P5H5_9BACT|nr:serine hydrolase domain-containing protein [Pyxidicoccus parkwaysis]QSQ25749.1 beta-lactamase family protein [Pyxidicoccus parkwaysis]